MHHALMSSAIKLLLYETAAKPHFTVCRASARAAPRT
jgi:hypothetical protein